MYATGSREEIEALAKHIETNGLLIRRYLQDGKSDVAEELAEINGLFCGMLLEAIKDHFNGKN